MELGGEGGARDWYDDDHADQDLTSHSKSPLLRMIFPVVIPAAQLLIGNDLKCFANLHKHFFCLFLLQCVLILVLVWVPFECHLLVCTLDHASVVFVPLYTQYFVPIDTVHIVHLLVCALHILRVLIIAVAKEGHQKWW